MSHLLFISSPLTLHRELPTTTPSGLAIGKISKIKFYLKIFAKGLVGSNNNFIIPSQI